MPKLVRNHSRIWLTPSVTLVVMSSSWPISWLPTKDSRPLMTATVPMTVTNAARPAGMTRFRPT